ncbi:MAG: hypothetical protein Phyf2KO_18360 [Phycisphaerales bacterium]
MVRTVFACACFTLGLASNSSAQGSYRYEFDMVVSSNALIDMGISSRFDELVVGTPGRLSFEVEESPFDIPGFSADNQDFYSILNVQFSVGSVATSGAPGQYPSTQPFPSLLVADDVLISHPSGIYADQFSTFISLEAADIAAVQLLLSKNAPMGFTDLWSDTALPTADMLANATHQSFLFQTTYDLSARINFDFTAISRSYIPAPSVAFAMGIAGFVATKRRR